MKVIQQKHKTIKFNILLILIFLIKEKYKFTIIKYINFYNK